MLEGSPRFSVFLFVADRSSFPLPPSLFLIYLSLFWCHPHHDIVLPLFCEFHDSFPSERRCHEFRDDLPSAETQALRDSRANGATFCFYIGFDQIRVCSRFSSCRKLTRQSANLRSIFQKIPRRRWTHFKGLTKNVPFLSLEGLTVILSLYCSSNSIGESLFSASASSETRDNRLINCAVHR